MRGRRRREAGFREGRRPVLPVRHLLHDEVPVRAAASVERRLPAPDAAREGAQVQATATRHAARPLLTSTDRVGKLATIPVVVRDGQCGRTAMPAARAVMDKHARRRRARRALPPYAADALPRHDAPPSLAWPVRNGARTPGKVAIFSTCYVNYNEPGIGHDLLKILEHNGIPYALVDAGALLRHAEARARRPRDGREARRTRTSRSSRALARDGLRDPHAGAVVHADVQAGAAADVSRRSPTSPRCATRCSTRSSTSSRATRTACSTATFKRPLGKVSYHIPCHSRVQNVGQKTREVLEWVPGTEVTTVERCAGHDGTWGVKSEFYADVDEDRQAGVRADGRAAPDFVSSDCPIAGRRIAAGHRAGRRPGPRRARSIR